MRLLLTVDPEIPVPPEHYGGIERIVAGLVRELRRRGHHVGLVAHPESMEPVDVFFPWSASHSNGLAATAQNTWALRRAIRRFTPDVVHSFSRLAYLLPVMSSRLSKIMSYQREPTRQTVRLSNGLSRGTLTFTGCSDYICGLGRQAGGLWQTVHNFVDPEQFTFVPKVAHDAPLVFLSRVESIKGPHLAIEAAKAAGHRLLIAGNHSATPAEADYWNTMIKPHLGKDGIEYIGTVNDQQKNELLGQAAALIVPIQWNEPFGIVFVEAMACGTPVITSPRGAAIEIVDAGSTGYLPVDAESLLRVIGETPKLSRAACRLSVEDRFSTRKIASRYESLYSCAVAGPGTK